MGPALEIGNSPPEEDEWTDNPTRRAPKRADVLASGNDGGMDMR